MADKRVSDTPPDLEAFFAEARAAAPLPGAGLVGRILADADAEIDARRGVPGAAIARGGDAAGGWLRGLLGGLGGWPSLAGLASAAITGLLIGYSSPDTLETVSGGYLSADTGYDLGDLDGFSSSYAALLAEG